MPALPIAFLFLLFACAPEPTTSTLDDDFRWDHSVRVTQPANGATVSETFAIEWETGDDVSTVQLQVSGTPHGDPIRTGTRNRGVFRLTLDEGRHRLNVEGLDDAGQVVSAHDLTVRVAATETPWVTIVSPRDRSLAFNPVTFTVGATEQADQIVIEADGWTIGEVGPSGTLTRTFNGTGFPRVITTTAFRDGEALATDSISLTVTDAQSPETSSYNDVVLDRIATYPTDGSYGYYWPRGGGWAGTTQDIWYLDTRVATGDPYQRSYCVGLTWEVFMRAFETLQSRGEAARPHLGRAGRLGAARLSHGLVRPRPLRLRRGGGGRACGHRRARGEPRRGAARRLRPVLAQLRQRPLGDLRRVGPVARSTTQEPSPGSATGPHRQGSTDGIGDRVENFGMSRESINSTPRDTEKYNNIIGWAIYVARVFAPSDRWPARPSRVEQRWQK